MCVWACVCADSRKDKDKVYWDLAEMCEDSLRTVGVLLKKHDGEN